jgi:hypothetical protein
MGKSKDLSAVLGIYATILYKVNGLWFNIYAYYSWLMALNSAPTHHSVTYRTGKDYRKKQKKIIVRTLAFNK